MRKSPEKITKSWYFKIGLVALLLRLILMPIASHPDIWSLNSARYFFVEKGEWNVYDYLASLPADHVWSKNYGQNYFTYPPLSYFTSSFFSFFLKPFYQPEITPWVMKNYPNIYGSASISRHLFLFKLPYLFFDFGIAYLLCKLFSKEKEKKAAFALWLFNPASLYSAYLVGQFELQPLFFVVLSLFLAKKEKPTWAAVALGVGGAYKMFPLFFLPILAFSLGKTLLAKTRLFIYGLLPFVLSVLPFLGSPFFRQLVLFSNQSQKFLHMSLPLSGAEAIYLFIFLWGLVFFISYYQRQKKHLWLYFLSIMLIFFSLTHYHPQWFVWLTPLLVIQLVKTKFKLSFLTVFMFFSWLVITLCFESSLNYGLFVPLNPTLWEAPSLSLTINRFYDVFQLKSIIRSLFAAAGAAMIFYSWRASNEKV
jgi:Gpi18-like mannosyltransferase